MPSKENIMKTVAEMSREINANNFSHGELSALISNINSMKATDEEVKRS